mmetsp:Transcript_817/g.1939  ORF Transcript_817/g.1939 Transcript_817/m.1939 type:complete len:418 (+) Transcript_817:356-1609(+)|eukprot:CAMPEP_0119562422 /NCGR_PEP_ID=MMETSP1352-20130426/20391_1 /TAXON_ID=265584 /ORGANISM="Stauroneis constricta, Strain CCMP1120" /LENGTH=417 /DNA_ID=CAMNT_0007610821 /DNA_START=266 /DNA_END=1519 /DNA_ORIENTATION=-
MGCGSSAPEPAQGKSEAALQRRPGADDPAELAKSSGIDRELDRARQQEELKVKLLLLGAGESGKSTIFKQMRILYGSPRSDDDQRMYGVVVRSNIITAMRKLCQLLRTLGLEDQLAQEAPTDPEDPTTPKEAFDQLIAHLVDNTAAPIDDAQNGGSEDWVGHSARAGLGPNNDAKQFLQLWRPMKILWDSATMREVWQRRSQANIIDGHNEYLHNISRIASPQFRPTSQDILLARVKTTQVVMERYRIDGIDFEMYDVGGQRSERRKWIDCFDNVDAVIFVAALSEYDQTLAEARRTNRMVEALELFKSVCNNRAFANTSIMLFLNKKDVFAEKILFSDIQAQPPFRDYAGPPHEFNSGVLYFIQKFKDCLINDDFNDSFIHVTCATDTNNMEFVLDSTRTIIMTDNLRRSGFLGSG